MQSVDEPGDNFLVLLLLPTEVSVNINNFPAHLILQQLQLLHLDSLDIFDFHLLILLELVEI